MLFYNLLLHAQSVGIGTTTPSTSAALEIKSLNKGLIIPSMTSSIRTNIVNPAEGLLVYDTTSYRIYQYQNGTWRTLITNEYWAKPSTRNWVYNGSDSVGIGTASPDERLDVNGNILGRNNMQIANYLTVGSAITSPQFKLHVYDDMGIRSTATTGGQINFEDENGVDKNFINLTGNDMKIGTISSNNNGKFIVRTNGNDRLFVDSAGNVTIGSAYKVAAGYKVSVNGKIICEELKVQMDADWPDYVFDKNYKLMPLTILQKKVMQQKHLPGIPSAAQVNAAQGIELGDMQKKLLEKVEELYRYVFQLNNENQQLKKEVEVLKKKSKN